jgi:PAS domain S-box-containing protein
MSKQQYSPESWDGVDRRIKDSTPPVRYTVIWIGLLVGLGFYVADIIIDVFVFRSGTLSEEILNPTFHEVWMRTGVVIVAVAFAIYVQILLRREQKISERAMIAERFLNSVVDNIPSMVFIKDARELRFIRINHTGEQILGLTTQELLGKNDYDFFPESQADFFTHKDREVLESGAELNILEEEIDTAALGKRWLHTRKVPILDDKGQPIYLLGISEDITEIKRAEEEMQQQQRELAHVMRLSTMGEMASGMAHELNQPLTALTSYCGTAAMLVKSLPSSQPQLGEMLERAKEQAHRASQIIHHLRDFLGKTDDHKESLDLDLVIVRVIEFIKPELKNGHVKIEHQPGTQGCKVRANKVQIEQVLVNLVLNSLEAIKVSGKSTGNIIVQTRLLPNETMETTVTDNGPGIDADMADKIFNPFQTSKSSGMGMGLSISRTIVDEHGGNIWADVQHGNGALFGFNLPVCELPFSA